MDTWQSEELIRDFYEALRGSGVPAQSARRQRDRLRFFLHAYLAEQWPRSLCRVDGEILRDFLGSWFLRNVGGGKSDLISYLATFRRFFDRLYHQGRISRPEHEDLMATCRNRDYFMARYDEHFNPAPEAGDDLLWGRPRAAESEAPAPGDDFELDRQLWMLMRNLERPFAPAALDFALFLDYLADNSIKLTRAQLWIPSRHVRVLNQRFSVPERLDGRVSMEGSLRLRWFYHLGLALDLWRVNDRHQLSLLPRAEAFLDLDPESRLSVLLETTWNRIRWSSLGHRESRRVSEWAQDNRLGFAALLAELTPFRESRLDPEPGLVHEDTLLARYVLFHEVVENSVLFALRECGLLDYQFWKQGNKSGLRTRAITINRFGRQVMRLFAKRASRADQDRQDPLAGLQEALLF